MGFPYRRIFLICAGPAEIFSAADAERAGGRERPAEALRIPNLRRLGLANFMHFRTVEPCKCPSGRYIALRGDAGGTDAESGLLEMMGAGPAGHAEGPGRRTAPEALKAHGDDVICIGRTADLFKGRGIAACVKTDTWEEAMDEAVAASGRAFTGLCLVDAGFGSVSSGNAGPADPDAAGSASTAAEILERFDRRLGRFYDVLTSSDLLLFTAVRGSGTGSGTGGGALPLIGWSPNIMNGTGGRLPGAASAGVIGAAVCANFGAEFPGAYAGASRIEDFR